MKKVFEDIKNRNIAFVVICIILLLMGVGVRIYWSMQKEAYNIDEVHSYQFIGGGNRVMPHRDEALLDKWHDGAFFADYVTIDEDEKYDFSRVTGKTAQDVHPPLYYWFLHFSTIAVDDGEINLRGGILLNVVAFILSAILLYFLAFLILKNKILSLGICIIWSFSVAAISDAVFLRMYGVLTTTVTALTLALYYFIRAKKPTWFNYAGIIFVTIVGLLTHYFFIFLLISLSLYIFLRLLVRKKYRQLAIYMMSIVGSIIIAYILFPSAKEHLFSSYRSREMVDKIALSSTEKITIFMERLKEFNVLFNEQLFAGVFIFIILLLLAVVIKGAIKKNNNKKFPELLVLTGSVSMFWVIVVVYLAPYADMRYLAPILPLLILTLVGAVNYLVKSYKLKYGMLIVFIVATFFQLFHGDISYIYAGSDEKWRSIEADHITPAIIVVSKKRAFTINAIMQYLVDKERVYVTTVEQLSDHALQNDLFYNSINNSQVYVFVEKKAIDELNFSEYGTKEFLFSYTYYDVYRFSINHN